MMEITATGKIEKKGFGFGVWALVSQEGKTYELYQPPSELCQSIAQVKITGKIREDIMTAAMIGKVLEVTSFTIQSP
ncbi:MAG: hypothetical protein QNJ60_03735 [Xenococcaceae cyanobacterium MO_188.B19]|nr:hypothetical protein [Xenococcaceae cyanobacterium MO_188.B19]